MTKQVIVIKSNIFPILLHFRTLEQIWQFVKNPALSGLRLILRLYVYTLTNQGSDEVRFLFYQSNSDARYSTSSKN